MRVRVPWVNVPWYQIQAQFQSGITFFNTLSMKMRQTTWLSVQPMRLALLVVQMSEEELEAAGLNRSDVHVDFMIGSNQMDIDGIREDGMCTTSSVTGDWAN